MGYSKTQRAALAAATMDVQYGECLAAAIALSVYPTSSVKGNELKITLGTGSNERLLHSLLIRFAPKPVFSIIHDGLSSPEKEIMGIVSDRSKDIRISERINEVLRALPSVVENAKPLAEAIFNRRTSISSSEGFNLDNIYENLANDYRKIPVVEPHIKDSEHTEQGYFEDYRIDVGTHSGRIEVSAKLPVSKHRIVLSIDPSKGVTFHHKSRNNPVINISAPACYARLDERDILRLLSMADVAKRLMQGIARTRGEAVLDWDTAMKKINYGQTMIDEGMAEKAAILKEGLRGAIEGMKVTVPAVGGDRSRLAQPNIQ